LRSVITCDHLPVSADGRSCGGDSVLVKISVLEGRRMVRLAIAPVSRAATLMILRAVKQIQDRATHIA
jgi:hypothetical protein